MAAYSIDLRERIVQAYENKIGSQQRIANIFGVSLSFVEKLLHRRRTTGQIAPLPHGGGRRSAFDKGAISVVQGLVKEQADITLWELCESMRKERGISVSIAAMCLLLKRLGLGRKKRLSTPVSETASVSKGYAKSSGR